MAGSTEIDEHWAIDLVTSLLAVTKDMGMACRIMPRKRSTPEKDFWVPDPVKALPFLPSIDSAYQQGYRRMIVAPVYSDVDVLNSYADDVLFICGSHGADVGEALMSFSSHAFAGRDQTLLKHVVAAFAVATLELKGKKTARVSDVYVPAPDIALGGKRFGELMDVVRKSRVVRWEEQVVPLLDSKALSLSTLRKAFRRCEELETFLSTRKLTV